jgi:hypothetical protein
MTKRAPRLPTTPDMLPSFAEALEGEILAVIKNWPELMACKLNAAGLGTGLADPELGHTLLQARIERALTDQEPDALGVVVQLAEVGHVAARRALERHITATLENPKADPPSSMRAYLVRLVPDHPQTHSAVLTHLARDIGIVVMVDAAAARWQLPKLKSSSRQRSAAHYVATTLSHCGIPLTERQVRRIHQARATFAQRLGQMLGDDGYHSEVTSNGT